jgi:glycerol-1-phosphate dehydrogenase [NAD(P)+]
MNEAKMQSALEGATDTEDVLIGSGVVAQVADVFKKNFGDATAVVVSDENEFAVAGQEVNDRLAEAGVELLEPYLFPGKPTLHADYENIKTLIGALSEHDAIPVAVGSGVLNDIAKRAAYETDRGYMNVGTAASMDGYTAFGASITKEGYKQTMTCPAPKAVLADTDVLTGAPPPMTAAGYADLLGKVTAGGDWIIADTLGAEPIDRDVWALVQDDLREWTGDPAALSAGDGEAMGNLIGGLIMSGLAMQAHQSSRPASGAEHQFSHLWEMEGLGHEDGPHGEPPLSHGFKVGLGSIAIAGVYERLLERDLSQLDVDAAVAAWPSWEEVEKEVRAQHTTPGLDEAAVAETKAKYVDRDALRARLEKVREVWPQLREDLRKQLMPADQLREQLRLAGAPTKPSDIGLDMQRFKDTYIRSQMIRRRYTVLDLAKEAGILEQLVDELFAPGGFWAAEGA